MLSFAVNNAKLNDSFVLLFRAFLQASKVYRQITGIFSHSSSYLVRVRTLASLCLRAFCVILLCCKGKYL